MTAIRYAAARADGAVLHGVLNASDRQQALGLLLSQGLHPLSLEVDTARSPERTATGTELALLFRSLASLVGAGVPLGRALLASRPVVRGALRQSLPELERSLNEGSSLSSALERTNGLVPTVVCGMVRAGERASRLADALDQIALHLEQEVEFRNRLQGALTYPLILLCTGMLSVGVIAFVILPRFAVLLGDLGQELPASTRLLLAAATALRLAAPFLPLLLATAVGGAVLVLRHRPTMARLAAAALTLPVVGLLRHSLVSARWLRGFAATLASGMPVLAALDAAADASADPAIRRRTAEARERVAQGESVTAALTRTQVITPRALQVVAIGDASGQLAPMARRAGDLAAQDGERRLRQFVSLLEPALVIGFGVVVAFVAAALLQAVYAIRPAG